MPKILPANESLIFLVSDDVRSEPGDKLTILGLLLGEVKVSRPAGKKALLNSLSMLFVFKDGEGEFSGTVKVVDPQGKEIFLTRDTLVKQSGQPMVAGIRLQPFFPIDGTYTASVTLDDRVYEKTFRVVLVDTPPVQV